MLKQRLQQKLLQKLSPQQIQLIKLLEVPTIQLEQRIKKELEENPVLEEGIDNEFDIDQQEEAPESAADQDEFSLDDYIEDDEIPNYKTNARNYSKDDEKGVDIPFSVGNSFHENLQTQLGLRMVDEHTEALALYIIGNIDEPFC